MNGLDLDLIKREAERILSIVESEVGTTCGHGNLWQWPVTGPGEITIMTKLIENADLTHEDSRGWYDSYGWHISTENEGDVTIGAVEYDWLDGTDDEAIAKLRERVIGLTDGEAESIVAKAREVREAAETVDGLLGEAVEAYQSGDMDAVVRALDEAAMVESEHGDSPAASDLRSQLLANAEEDG